MVYSKEQIDLINSSKSAQEGVKYAQDNGDVYIGTYNKTLNLYSTSPALPVGASTESTLSSRLKPTDTLNKVSTIDTITNVVHIDDNGGSLTIDAISLPLPTGASTSANQTTTNTKLDTLIAKDFSTSSKQDNEINLLNNIYTKQTDGLHRTKLVQNALDVSNSNPLYVRDFYLEVNKGNIPNHTLLNLFARNSNVGITTEDVVPMSNIWTPPTTYRTMNVVSSSALDTALGTGARTISLLGITALGVEEEVLTLNGTTSVNGTKLFACILESEIETWGTTLANAGNITITANVDLSVQNLIPIGENESGSGVFYVPVGFNAYLFDWSINFQNVTNTCQLDARLTKKQGFSGGYHSEDFILLYASANSIESKKYNGGKFIGPDCFIKTQVISSITASDVNVNYNVLLVKL